ncbi:glutamyl-tRNA reductase [Coraliomargarita algicola]|uniref:Glutamyl-tRNA reductase n=2 Tax=Coraliomargaritaceae TaxID=3056371 RepID=A0ABU1AR27_9BACT|nr:MULTISPECIES: glutamyl-tRNA reductase [unclassified Coraliomargarita]MDQ8206607.1 glutamyl-tRNA reductase [Coraliomargarita sp. SDUM461003]WPJ94510.1 glutamyl-tRNA reductase [Coraliomargarita sp. J2-16]
MSDVLQSLFVLGTSHHATPLDVRERFALTQPQALELQQRLHAHEGIRECLVLNTCNRLEIYGLADRIERVDEIRELFCEKQNVPIELFQQYAYSHNNLEALQHVLEVSTGLDSQMVGETEILGQLKQAYTKARDAKCTGNVLNRLFEKSFQAAKAARSQTGITRGQISIGNVAVDLASRIFGQLSKSRVLLLGSGEVGEKTAQALKSRGADDIAVSSRTFENAHKLAHELGGSAIDFEDFKAQLEHFDIVICSTAAPGTILDRSIIAQSMKRRPERPCFLIDLALPRDIDPAVEDIENVYLYNLDDLSTIANENLTARKAEIDNAREILKKHAWNLWLQLRRRELMRRA